jgi:gluconolactonase
MRFLVPLLLFLQIANAGQLANTRQGNAGQTVKAQRPKVPPPPKQKAIRGIVARNSVLFVVKRGFQRLDGLVGTRDGELYFSDIGQNRTYWLDHNGTISVWRERTNAAAGLFFLADGRLLAAERGYSDRSEPGRIVAVSHKRQVTGIATEFNGKPFHGPNNLIADRKGGIYFTDPESSIPSNNTPRDGPGDIYYIRPNGEILLLDDKMVDPCGIELSLDEKMLFVDDTSSEYVYSFDVQPDGQLGNKRAFLKLQTPEEFPVGETQSRAGGMTIDSKGRLYIATAYGVEIFDPEGEYIGLIRAPEMVRDLAFAGPWRQSLYMTAATSLYRIDLLAQGPARRVR